MSTATLSIQQSSPEITFGRILMGSDFSPASFRALNYAMAIAYRYGSELSIIHALGPEPHSAVPMDPLPPELNREGRAAQEQIDELQEQLTAAGVRHRAEINVGRPAEVIAASIQRERPDLVVLGTHGRSMLGKLALGSVTEEVLRTVPSAVLTIGPHVPPPEMKKMVFRNILFATDFGVACTRAFRLALGLAEQHGSKLVLMHMQIPVVLAPGAVAFSPGDYAYNDVAAWCEEMRQTSLRRLRELIPSETKLRCPPELLVETSFLPDGIIDTALLYGCDLIVMGVNRTHSPRLVAHLPWSVVYEVLRRAPSPVLTVGTEKTD
jgi:nucleotide-binding universal stress UspA family protein